MDIKKRMSVFSNRPSSINWIPEAIFEPNMLKADLVLFGGGTDISPHLYRQTPGRHTQRSDKGRDEQEERIFKWAIKYEVPMIGLCRGAQLLEALSGGKLIQHVSNHHSHHEIITREGLKLEVNSLHHQMAYPYDMNINDYEVIAWSEGLSNTYLDEDDKEMCIGGIWPLTESEFKEPEIVYYTKTNSLGIQSHPEFMGYPKETTKYIIELMKTTICKDLPWAQIQNME